MTTRARRATQKPTTFITNHLPVTIDDTRAIDIIATKPGSSEVRLIIADHLDWSSIEAHAIALQEKINSYLAFVESGQLARTTHPPIPDSPEIRIEVHALHRAPPEAEDFLARVRRFLAEEGFEFSFEHHPSKGLPPDDAP
jgi:hypothetical protein